MRWFLALIAVFLAAPAFAQENEAEKLYRAFEKKLVDAKAFSLSFECEMMAMRGAITIAAGNRMKMSYKGMDRDKKPFDVTVIYDGKSSWISGKDGDTMGSEAKAVPEGWSLAHFPRIIAEGGVALSPESSTEMFEIEPPKKALLKNFKLGVIEKVGGRETRIIEYEWDPRKEHHKSKIVYSLWLDVTTSLPAKRVVEVIGDGQKYQVDEHYSNWQINPALNGDEFNLPK